MKQRLTQWVMLAGCALAIFCGGRPEQAHVQQGGIRMLSGDHVE